MEGKMIRRGTPKNVVVVERWKYYAPPLLREVNVDDWAQAATN